MKEPMQRGRNPARSGKVPVTEGRALPAEFFNAPAEQVARQLLGKRLVRVSEGAVRSLAITETEAYVGPHDLACHAARGRTRRTEVMFGAPGTLYVYLIYGMHWMLNVVTGAPGYPAAVLIRGVEGLSGPGRLARALAIDRVLNGKPAVPGTGLWFADDGYAVAPRDMRRTPRIGVDYAGPVWAAKSCASYGTSAKASGTRSSPGDHSNGTGPRPMNAGLLQCSFHDKALPLECSVTAVAGGRAWGKIVFQRTLTWGGDIPQLTK